MTTSIHQTHFAWRSLFDFCRKYYVSKKLGHIANNKLVHTKKIIITVLNVVACFNDLYLVSVLFLFNIYIIFTLIKDPFII